MCPFFILVTLGVSVFNLECCMVLGQDPSAVLPSSSVGLCLNCAVCEHPCHPLPPPSPLGGYSSYGAPPSPPSFSGYPSYGAPPPPSLSTYGAPPPPSRPVQPNCPPPPVQCCQYPTNPNPNPNEYYHPVDQNHSPTTPYSPVSTFSIVIVLLLPFAGLFF